MIKFLGMLILVIAGGLSGRLGSRVLEERLTDLTSCRQAFHLLETEISYALCPLPQAFCHVSDMCQGRAGLLFGSAAEILKAGEGVTAGQAWLAALKKHTPEMALNDGDIEVLASFAPGLGLCAREDQLRKLSLLEQALSGREENAGQHFRQMGKVWRSIGWCAGITVAMLWL